MTINLGIIGSGSVAPFHIEAALDCGFNVTCIASSQNSQSAKILQRKYGIKYIFANVARLLNSKKYDCLSIMIPPVAITPYFGILNELNVPILIEKPVSESTQKMEDLVGSKKIFAAYNRRFYTTINTLKHTNIKNAGIFKFYASESISNYSEAIVEINYQVKSNTVHILDLINYIIGKYELKDFAFSITNYNLNCRIFQGSAYRGDLQISFNSKKNTCIEFENNEFNLILKPIEHLEMFDALRVVEPDSNNSFRKYEPILISKNLSRSISETGNTKPGFKEQYSAFYEFCITGNNLKNLATMMDALYTLKKAEQIVSEYKRQLASFNIA